MISWGYQDLLHITINKTHPMSVHWGHDIYRVPPSKRVPLSLYVVRPDAPPGRPGVYAEFRDFHEACHAAMNDRLMRMGMRYDPNAIHKAVPRTWRSPRSTPHGPTQ